MLEVAKVPRGGGGGGGGLPIKSDGGQNVGPYPLTLKYQKLSYFWQPQSIIFAKLRPLKYKSYKIEYPKV